MKLSISDIDRTIWHLPSPGAPEVNLLEEDDLLTEARLLMVSFNPFGHYVTVVLDTTWLLVPSEPLGVLVFAGVTHLQWDQRTGENPQTGLLVTGSTLKRFDTGNRKFTLGFFPTGLLTVIYTRAAYASGAPGNGLEVPADRTPETLKLTGLAVS